MTRDRGTAAVVAAEPRAALLPRFPILAGVALFLSLALVLPTRGQQEPLEQRPSFRADVELVLLYVSVFDRQGRPVTGLGKEDFVVAEDGVEQEITQLLVPSDAPLDVALVLDVSGSMQRDASSVKRNASHFLRSLGEEDCAYLLPFNHRVGPGRRGRPGDRRFQELLREVELGGGTALYDAVLEATSWLEGTGNIGGSVPSYTEFLEASGEPGAARTSSRAGGSLAGAGKTQAGTGGQGTDPRGPAGAGEAGSEAPEHGLCSSPTRGPAPAGPAGGPARRRAMVAITDGLDESSAADFTEALEGVFRVQAPVFPVAMGRATRGLMRGVLDIAMGTADPSMVRRNEKLRDQLRELARVTGGRFLDGESDELRSTYEEILGLLHSGYVVGYPAPSRPPVGSDRLTWHRVDVETRRPGLRAVSRSGYYRSGSDVTASRSALASGVEALRQGRAGEALFDVERAARAAPGEWQPHHYRAVALSLLGRLEEAGKAVLQALELAPERPRVHELAWWINYRLENDAMAWKHAALAQGLGIDMGERMEELRRRSEPPFDLERRLGAPRLVVEDPLEPDLVVQAALDPVVDELRRALSAAPEVLLVPDLGRADYALVLDPVELKRGSRRRLEGDVRLLGILGDEILETRLDLTDIDDPGRRTTELRRVVEKIVDELAPRR